LLELIERGHKNPADTGIFKLKMDLPCCQGSMGRDINCGRGEYANVGYQPFDAVLAQHGDPVSRLNAGLHKGGGTSQRIGPITFPSHVVVQTVALEAQGRTRPEPFTLATVQVA